jgi:hypothetical protein
MIPIPSKFKEDHYTAKEETILQQKSKMTEHPPFFLTYMGATNAIDSLKAC